MTPSPNVSIYMAVYNQGRFLDAALRSLSAQSYGDFEIVLVNDGSTDGTLPVARAWAERDSRIRVVDLPHIGVVRARNEAIQQCCGSTPYLLNHDGDDLSCTDKLARLVDHLDNHPEVAAVGCLASYLDEAGNETDGPPLETSPERIRRTFGTTNSMVHSATLIRRQVFDTLGGYDPQFPCASDYHFFSQALLSGFALENLPRVLHKIRLHAASIGAARRGEVKKYHDRIAREYSRRLEENDAGMSS